MKGAYAPPPSLYFRSLRPDAGQIQSPVRPDQTADRLLRDRRTDWCAGLLFCPVGGQPEPCGPRHDCGHAPVLFLRPVRAQRPAARGGGPALLPGALCPAESPALPHQQLLCRSCRSRHGKKFSTTISCASRSA